MENTQAKLIMMVSLMFMLHFFTSLVVFQNPFPKDQIILMALG